MHRRPLYLIVLFLVLAATSPALADAEVAPQKAPKELIHPKLSPLDSFRNDLASLREALTEDMVELRSVAKAALPEDRAAAADAVRERKQRYELDLLRLQLKLHSDRGESEKSSAVAATLERLEALYAQDGGQQ